MPLTRWAQYHQIRAQKKKALYLLALSGAIRPSTIELRYTAPLSPLADEQGPVAQDASTPMTATVRIRPAETVPLAQHFYSTAFMLLTKSKRHIQRLQWDTRRAA